MTDSNEPTARNPGHIRASIKPRAVHFDVHTDILAGESARRFRRSVGLVVVEARAALAAADRAGCG